MFRKINRKAHFRISAALALAIYFYVGVGFGEGMALCIGADGHVEIEHATNGKCNSVPLSVAPNRYEVPRAMHPVGLEVPDDHCGICIDIPLGGDRSAPDVQVVVKSFAKFEILSAPLEARFFSPPAIESTREERLAKSCQSQRALVSLRTIVLVI